MARIFTILALAVTMICCAKKQATEAQNEVHPPFTTSPKASFAIQKPQTPENLTSKPVDIYKSVPVKTPEAARPPTKPLSPAIENPIPIQQISPPPIVAPTIIAPPAKPAAVVPSSKPIQEAPTQAQIVTEKQIVEKPIVEENLSKEEMKIESRELVEEIGIIVKENPTGSGRYNSKEYFRKDIISDGTAYQIIVGDRFFQVRKGDPKINDEFTYFLGSGSNFELTRVMHLSGKIEPNEVHFEIKKMELNFSLSIEKLKEEVKGNQSFGFKVKHPDYRIYVFNKDRKASTFLFTQVPTETVESDTKIQDQYDRQWHQILSKIKSTLTNTHRSLS